MEITLKIVHVLVSIFLVLVVLLQAGRGGGVGAAFGGASAQLFGGRGASNFLSRLTSGAAVVFFLTSLSLSMLSSQHQSVMRGHRPRASSPPEPTAPSEQSADTPATAPSETEP